MDLVQPRRRSRTATILAVCALVLTLMATREARGAGAAPDFLVATVNLADPVFQRSVILMLPGAQGPLVAGLIINKPTNIPLEKLFPGVAALKNNASTAYLGGPVNFTEPSLILRASQPAGKAIRLFDDVYVSTDPDSIGEILKNSASAKDLRLFLGRAQWTRDQLHGEILAGAWDVMPASADFVFSSDPKRIWRVLNQRAQLHEVEATNGVDLAKLPVFSLPSW